ncbi:MAG: PLAT/LH2 domain-containing protein [Bacteroidota bacterium]
MKIVKQAIQFSFFLILLAAMTSCGGNSSSSADGTETTAGTSSTASSSAATNANLGQPTSYRITFRTGCDEKGGTKAKVYVMIIGAEGRTDELQMVDPTKPNFVSCSQDIFNIPVEKDLGEIQEVRLWHDNTGDNPSWLVELAQIKNVKTNARWMFPCGKWLDGETGDQSTSRILYPGKECS